MTIPNPSRPGNGYGLSQPIWATGEFALYPDSIVQQHGFVAKALSSSGIISNYSGAAAVWNLSKDISSFPRYSSDYPITDALYNMALEEMQKAIEPDSTFRTGKEWAGVWTRDISYSIILSMAQLQPQVARNSLMKKVNTKGRIIQDTGTGGAWPVSSDRMIWALAAWELYKTTGNKDWLEQAYRVIRNSIDDDLETIYDSRTGLVRGESSFLDWREQTYPAWMQPADIYESENLGTNAVHYEANRVLARMARLLGDGKVASRHERIAAAIKAGINRYLWIPEKQYYAQYLYGRSFKMISPRSEALGEALSVLFDIADSAQQKEIIAHTPLTHFGISCIYPQIPGIPPYHNNAVWPFVQAYWLLASAKAGNEGAVMESIGDIYRPASLFLTNKENFVADDGDFAGTQINSSNMLWSLSGNISILYKLIFGMRFNEKNLQFQPFVPKVLSGHRSLSHFIYRQSVLNIYMEGFGNKIASFRLDGIKKAKAIIPATIKGEHTITIRLADNTVERSTIHKVENYTSLPNPITKISEGRLEWHPVNHATGYRIYKNGRPVSETTDTAYQLSKDLFGEYQVIALDKNKVGSFASEPVLFNKDKRYSVYELEDYAEAANFPYTGFNGKGFVEISQDKNRNIQIPVTIKYPGEYSINFRYSNGNGPVNTENKCAIRTIRVDGKFLGAVVFPQRGKGEWSNWGYSNSQLYYFGKGKHVISVSFEGHNENMNGYINQAMLDDMYLVRNK